MIFGNFENMDNSGIPKAIQSIVKDNALSVSQLSKMEPGLYEIENTGITYLIKDFATDFKENRPAEFHEKYVDLQLVLEGEETIYFDHSSKPYELIDSPKPDVYLVSPIGMNNKVDLLAGNFAVFMTNEPHQALCSELGQQAVKKVVFKIPRQFLS